MQYRDFKTGDELINYLDEKIHSGLTLEIDGGSADYAHISYNSEFNLYTIEFYEYSVPYMCGYALSKNLLSALIEFSNEQLSDYIDENHLEIQWREYN
ncbi:hypothetical protein [Bacillus phage Sarmo]|nr:hypothetical protein [Bacillus phage Sarmo]